MRLAHPRGLRGLLLAAVLIAALVAAAPARAHLLNMTRATLSLEAGGAASATFEVDLSRAFPDRAAYHAASRLADPASDAEVRALVERMLASMHVETPSGRFETAWRLVTFEPEQASLARYEDPFHWPMTRVRVLAGEALAAEALQVHFDGRFPWEEPIALTIEHVVDDVRMTRWLVVDQRSPVFTPDATQAPNPIAPPTNTGPTAGAVEDAAPVLPALAALQLGFAHILPAGLDHVLFVALLVLLCARLRPTLIAVTLFTVAHALTLTATLLRWLPTPPAWIEVAIAASIVWLAIDVLRGARWNLLHGGLVLVFGLVHGLGFAAALSAQTLDGAAVSRTLVALNVGVELAQILVAAATLGALALLERTSAAAGVRTGTALLAGCVAMGWVVLRLQ